MGIGSVLFETRRLEAQLVKAAGLRRRGKFSGLTNEELRHLIAFVETSKQVVAELGLKIRTMESEALKKKEVSPCDES